MPDLNALSSSELGQLADLKVGVFSFDGAKLKAHVSPQDLSVRWTLPDLSNKKKHVREKLGPVFEKFNTGDWKDALNEACFELEEFARGYLWNAVRTTRIVVLTKTGSPEAMSRQKIQKLTLGQLSNCFGRIKTPNGSDKRIFDALTLINKDGGFNHEVQRG